MADDCDLDDPAAAAAWLRAHGWRIEEYRDDEGRQWFSMEPPRDVDPDLLDEIWRNVARVNQREAGCEQPVTRPHRLQ